MPHRRTPITCTGRSWLKTGQDGPGKEERGNNAKDVSVLGHTHATCTCLALPACQQLSVQSHNLLLSCASAIIDGPHRPTAKPASCSELSGQKLEVCTHA